MPDLRIPSANDVRIAGRLTRDPELRYLQSGTAVCELSVAISRHYRTKEGEKKEDVTFVSVETWEKTAEHCGQNLKKGSPVLVDGSLKMDEWTDKQGEIRKTLKIRAQRVQQLAWEDKPSRQEDEKPVSEPDMPF